MRAFRGHQGEPRAVVALKKQADGGDKAARFQLALIYQDGRWVKRDLEKAAYHMHEAAMAGLLEAQYRYGLMHYRGEGLWQDFRQAGKWFHEASKGEHLQAIFRIACMLERGLGQEAQPEKAAEAFLFAAKGGHAEAQFRLAKAYALGDGLEPSLDEAEKWLYRASKQRHERASELLARLEADEAQEPRLSYYQRQAKNGGKLATFRLALHYLQGLELEVDKDKGFELLQKAANLGVREALYLLGKLFLEGVEVKRDKIQGVSCLTEAAGKGHLGAHLWLGRIYHGKFQELGVQINENVALRHYYEAALEGSLEAQEAYAEIVSKGTPFQAPKPEEGLFWLGRAMLKTPRREWEMDKLIADAQNQISEPLKAAWEVQQKKALALRKQHGEALALLNETDNPKAGALACELFQSAAKGGHVPSITSLAFMFLRGEQLPQDLQKARLYFTRAGRAGDIQAQNALGILHRDGEGAIPDKALASEWFLQAEDAQSGLLPNVGVI